MTDLIVVPQAAHWQRLKRLVLDSVSSPITHRVYNLGLDEFFEWYGREPRPGFTKATVCAWRVALEARELGPVSINLRITAVRKLAVEAADNGLLAPELANGITRVKGVASKGVRLGNWLTVRQAQTLLNTPDITTPKGLRDRAIQHGLMRSRNLRYNRVVPRIFDNIEQQLLPALRQALDLSERADCCVGYFNLRGWKQIACNVERWSGGDGNCCRLLIGMQRLPQDELREALSLVHPSGNLDLQTAARLKKRMAEDFRDQLTYGAPTNEDERGLQHLAMQIRSRKVRTDLIRRLSPDSLSIMEFKNETDVRIAEKMSRFPLLGESIQGSWNDSPRSGNRDIF